MGMLIPLHRVTALPSCGGSCNQGRGPCDCGIGALTEADLDRHEAKRLDVLRYPRTLAEAFPDVRAAAIEIHRRPGLVRQLVDTVRAAWRDAFRWGW